MKIKLFAVGFILVISGTLSCKHKNETATTSGSKYCIPADFKAKIKIEEAISAPVTEGIHLMGSVETNPDKVVEYVSLVKGVVAGVYFSLGDAVKKGEVLAELRSAELSALQSQGSSIDAEIQAARRNLQAVQSMHMDQLASDQDLEEARSHLQSLQSEQQRIAADLSLYSANIGKGVFQIKAPASGIITSKSINAGMQISDESGVLFTIASLDNVWIMANVYASNLQSIQVGMSVEISTLSYPGEFFRGKISVLSPVMDENEKVLKARIELSNPNFKLKPGMLVDVTALKEQNHTACAIPLDAIIFSDNENYAVIYNNDCDVSLRKINITAQNDHYYYVDETLKTGEKIITQNQLLIFEQLKNFSE